MRLPTKDSLKQFAKRIVYLAYKPFKLLQQRRILARLKKKRPVKIAFQVHESAKWSCQSIYDAFDNDPMFEVLILVTPFGHLEPSIRDSVYRQTLNFFEAKGMNVAGVIDQEKGRQREIEEFEPDIIFFQEPFIYWFRELLTARHTGNSLWCYVPYSIAQTKNFQYGYDSHFCVYLWKYFVETPIHKQLAAKYGSTTKGDSVVVSGFAKMDVFLKDDAQTVQCSLWKTHSPQVKRIIYAPHWTIAPNEGGLFFSTFPQYHQSLLDYVRNHPEIEVILKPHPSLRKELVRQSQMTAEEVNNFFAAWNALPNGSVVEGGDYFDLFKTSDAMILDSISFICEYAYTGKPMQFLCRTPDILQNEFTEFGAEAVKHLYSAHSFHDIEAFIQDTVIGGNDPLKERREQFVNSVLKCSGKSAAEFVLEHIKKELT